MADIELSDIQAGTDVLAQLYREADSFDVQKAIMFGAACRAMRVQLDAAQAALDAQALHLLEQPVLIGKIAYSKKLKPGKVRARHDKIQERVVKLAVRDESGDGEVVLAGDAAERAVKMMAALYVSPSTEAKVGGVKALGYNMSDVTREEEPTGYELKVTELE